MSDEADSEPRKWVASVRARPGMYIGSTSSMGLNLLVYELVSNALDEFVRGRASEISVDVDGDSVEVFDDGSGLPFGEPSSGGRSSRIGDFLTTLRDTPSADNHAPHVHLTALGHGLALVNALTTDLEIASVTDGVPWEQRFNQGAVTTAEARVALPFERGTRVRFKVDREIFPDGVDIDRAQLRARLFDAVHLFPGLRVRFGEERFHAPGGLGDYAALRAGGWGSSVVSVDSELNGVRLVFAATQPWGSTGGIEPQFCSWANGSPTPEHGHHVSGVRDVLAEREWWPETVLLHVVMLSPEFAGPTKGRLVAPHVRQQVANMLRDVLPPNL